jgi:ubiquinone/menaquinone biosynthesis C-methylase UbiE
MKNPLLSLRFRARTLKRRLKHGLTSVFRKPAVSEKFDRTIRNAEAAFGAMRGKRILEVGADGDATLLKLLVNQYGALEAIGVNPCLSGVRSFGNYSLRNENAGQLSMGDSSIDAVLSISVLEHVHDLAGVLEELYRVLKPGGHVFAEFGPIWSSVWGHHLWLYHSDKVVDWDTHPLPPYAHLLYSEVELLAWCETTFHDHELAKKICRYVFHSDEQNRLFFSDYEAIFAASPFEVVCVTGYPDFPVDGRYGHGDLGDVFRRLRTRYPDKTGFGYHVMTVGLRKPS